MLVFTKAVIPAHGQSDLFPQTVQVKGHVRGTRFVLPHRSTRRKHIEEAPHQPEPPKPVMTTSQPEPARNMSPEAEKQWKALLLRGAAQKHRAQKFADAGKPVKFSNRNAPHLTYLVTPEVHEGHKQGAWRVTSFDDKGPVGHMEFNSAYDAFYEMRGNEPKPAPKPVVIMAPEKHFYRTILRPAGSGGLPFGVKWEYVEAPAMDGLARRPDLPTSKHRYGVISTNRALTAGEMEHFDIEAVKPSARA